MKLPALIETPTAVITGPEKVTFTTDQVSSVPGPNEILVKTDYSLISPGTELAIFQHTHVGFPDPNNSFAKYPFHPGYAVIGRVLAVGGGVTGFKEDDLVYYNGHHRAYSLLNLEKTDVLLLPEGADPKLLLFARMAQISSSALEVSSADRGPTVAVLGLGLVGNLAAQLFLQRGYDVLGVDLIASRCEIAKRCGIRALHVTPQDTVAQVRGVFAGAGAATVVEATGHPSAVAAALQMTARGGEMILLGSTRGKVELDVYSLIHAPVVTVRGAHENACSLLGGKGRPRELLRKNLDDIAAGRLIVGPLLTEVMEAKDIGAGYRRLCDHPAETLSLILRWPG
jgi:threonine dehydrogenase-like Zn-dependent dehydrogenase